MREVKTLVSNLLKSASNRFLSFDFKRVATSLATKSSLLPLHLCQMFFGLPKQPGIGYLLTVRQISKVLKSNVNTDSRAAVNGRLKLILNRETDKPVKTVPDYATGFNLAKHFTVKIKPNSAYFTEGQAVILNRPASLRIGKAIVAVAAFEAGEASFNPLFYPGKEGFESFIYPSQHILQHLTVDALKVWPDLFNRWKLVSLVIVVEGFISHTVSVPAFLQSPVVKLTTKTKRCFKFCFLSVSRKYSKFVSFAAFQLLLTLLTFDVFLHGLNSYTASGSYKIAVRPQARKLTFKLRKFLTKLSRACTLDELDQPVNTELRVTPNQQVNVLRHYFHFDELLPPLFYYLKNDSFKPFIYRWCQNVTPVLGAENNVIPARMGYIRVGFNLCIHTKIIPH